jgi:uncharacterized OB-fold protein
MKCKYCVSEKVVKNGKVRGEQVYKCNECGHRFVPHQSLGNKTPAQAARMDVPNNWKALIEKATKYEVETLAHATKAPQANNKALEAIVQ